MCKVIGLLQALFAVEIAERCKDHTRSGNVQTTLLDINLETTTVSEAPKFDSTPNRGLLSYALTDSSN